MTNYNNTIKVLNKHISEGRYCLPPINGKVNIITDVDMSDLYIWVKTDVKFNEMDYERHFIIRCYILPILKIYDINAVSIFIKSLPPE